MNTLINFSSELRTWILHNLDRGCAPLDLINTMVSQNFEHNVAQALISSFIQARYAGIEPPINSVKVDLPIAQVENVQFKSSIQSVNLIQTSDRKVDVLLRLSQPVIALLGNVFSSDECEQLIALSRPRLKPSTVVDIKTGEDKVAKHRSSDGMFFKLEEMPFISKLDRRISEIMNCPIENGEGLQVVRYVPGDHNAPHYDFLTPSNPANQASLERSGQRISTLIIYLNDVIAGGETFFPEVGLSVLPKKGNGLYFEYLNEQCELDYQSVHAGAEIIEGEKWIVTKWMRERRFISG